MSKVEIAKKTTFSIVKVAIYVEVYVVAAVIQWLFTSFLPQYNINIVDYIGYVQILLALAFSYLIIGGAATFFY